MTDYFNFLLLFDLVRIIKQDFPRMVDKTCKPDSNEILSYVSDLFNNNLVYENYLKKEDQHINNDYNRSY